ncbi:pyridoxal-phosphate dependent enzyme [Xenorhabdus mauleonii]|uniref:L-threonine dehydratase catabolic TdcB n=1 Tax=Xenorhabdus mauleonii TaxID=351675 RepID=A0A1I3X5S8_9GAMM|nr:threo-3-hydroxy-L-aspartate ammonia-lyase [Xenorhabdus mauleonii]PHM46309.1 pyridoxal-phosphate dependent enzyme [Xenorhabdus mauleonii]SFK14920.1 threonine dehydratase [Xenorhabdus mauleonii]
MKFTPDYNDISAAHSRIKSHLNKTPVITSTTVNELFDAQVYFKCENYQKMGAFKFRGAMNALSQFSDEQKKGGVVAFSSGNHAQAIALAAKLLNISATIVMPKDAPQAKVNATKGYGGQIVFYDRYTEIAEDICAQLVEKHGMTFIPPFNHPHIIAGQGTVAKDLFEEVGELDSLFVPLGGGGLLSGSALSASNLSPKCRVFGVEPEAGNDGQQSFRKGEIVHIDTPKTIADGAQTKYIGQYPFAIIRHLVEDILTASDEQLVDAMYFFAERMKMVVEPTGCLGFAAAKAMREQLKGQRIGIIVSGGNIDMKRYSELLASRV